MDTDQRIARLERAYRLFNDRQVEDLLALMTDDVRWPDVANGTVLHDKGAIRQYWAGQFSTSNPQVTPVEFIDAGDDLVAVVDQRILDLDGSVLFPPAVVFHRYAFAGDLIRHMAAFASRDAALNGD
ncbi:MAG TPA: nuclear transport factor 2 family protein [Acidimicrobiales bacterium]|nr:nuclear transport factor 2 family protein [Acidimicrobiales bacterium]